MFMQYKNIFYNIFIPIMVRNSLKGRLRRPTSDGLLIIFIKIYIKIIYFF